MCIDCHRRITAVVAMAISEGRFLPPHLASDPGVQARIAEAPPLSPEDQQACFVLASALTLCMPDPDMPLPFLKIDIPHSESKEFKSTFTPQEVRNAQRLAGFLANQFGATARVLDTMLTDNNEKAKAAGEETEPTTPPVLQFPRPRGAKPPVS